jgi:peptidase E
MVDLEFTGSLRDSMQVVKSGDDVFLAITNSTDYVKAKGQEARRKKPIFIPTAGERQDVENYLNDLISERVLSYF